MSATEIIKAVYYPRPSESFITLIVVREAGRNSQGQPFYPWREGFLLGIGYKSAINTHLLEPGKEIKSSVMADGIVSQASVDGISLLKQTPKPIPHHEVSLIMAGPVP